TSVSYNFTQPASPFVRPLGPGLLHLADGTPLERAEPLPVGDRDLLVARRLVEDAGGAAAGAEAAASGNVAPHLEISIYGRDGHAIARATYSFFEIGRVGPASVITARFEADLATGAVTRLP